MGVFRRLRWLPAGTAAVAAFQFPKIKFVGLPTRDDADAPRRRVRRSPDHLRRSVEDYCNVSDASVAADRGRTSFRWEPQLRESYEVADVVFQEVARVLRGGGDLPRRAADARGEGTSAQQVVLSFPSMAHPEDLDNLAAALRSGECQRRLLLENTCAELYPSAPAPYLRITFSEALAHCAAPGRARTNGTEARVATESWVNNFLGKYRLCPYTSSVSRAAVGLSSVGVPVGGVRVRVESAHVDGADTARRAALQTAELVSAFWSEVVHLLQSAPEEWATSLLVCPHYDGEFRAFVALCDGVLEPTVAATRAATVIGRAWFHPRYDADAVGHAAVAAGHAVPHAVVARAMTALHAAGGTDDHGLLDGKALAAANDGVRRTPHATINILRRSQLAAAGEYERRLGRRRPKANAIYVKNAVRLAAAMKHGRPP